MLLLTDKIRVGAWVFYIRKLKPSFFLANNNFPLNNFIIENEKKPSETNTEMLDKAFKLVLSSGIIKAKKWFTTYSVEDVVIMLESNRELQAYLFAEIVRISFNIKKKTKLLSKSMKPTHTRFIG